MAMQTRHKNQLFLKFDQLWAEGVVRMDRWEMVAIFDKQKVTDADWKLLGEYWNDYCGADAVFPISRVKITLGESPLPIGYYIFCTKHASKIPLPLP
ncbi:hypothetical protein [Pseudomonas rhodesiae]|uniref:hypothetical protein n=1 Tax=Pseudomonas rhodesiae TaxID=76760 RepID=UPI001F3E0120|nr:hypothetical protein [Pseudomonas rhodesiae]